MASAISLQGFSFGLHTNRSLNPLRFSVNSISINPSLSSPNSALGSRENTPKFKFKHIIYKASLEGVPSELVEDPKFVPLNAEDPRYGPPALLLLGFEAGEIVKIQQLLQELDGEFLKVIYCTEDMISRSLWEAMNTQQPNLEAVQVKIFYFYTSLPFLVYYSMFYFIHIMHIWVCKCLTCVCACMYIHALVCLRLSAFNCPATQSHQ
eukprot:TRINITY_DN3920_c0_g1_i2.p1 TRINITY_DN3920_c0_g1~~TRINITY_DN3920_c0_g1_i2.p1  ORF type:complete len:208 (+),score=16.22 TRINITY_DN3920_c0_g1_i2:38-661(+)